MRVLPEIKNLKSSVFQSKSKYEQFLKTKTINRDHPSAAVHIRDDAFSDGIQRTDSEASSGLHHDDRAPARNERQSPCDHTPEHRFGAALGR